MECYWLPRKRVCLNLNRQSKPFSQAALLPPIEKTNQPDGLARLVSRIGMQLLRQANQLEMDALDTDVMDFHFPGVYFPRRTRVTNLC